MDNLELKDIHDLINDLEANALLEGEIYLAPSDKDSTLDKE